MRFAGTRPTRSWLTAIPASNEMRVGIIGAGQLGQMLGLAARRMGITCRFLDPSEAPPAAAVGEVIRRPFGDSAALAELADSCDVVTYEFENVPVEALLGIADRVPVFPPPEALRSAQDRLSEKRLFDELQIPLPAYRAVDSLDDLHGAVKSIGLPLVLKTRRFGYDGKGQCVVNAPDDIDDAWRKLAGTDLIAIGAMRALQDAGRRIPEDVSVVGFDDMPLAAYVSPALTTVRQNSELGAEGLVNGIVGLIKGKPVESSLMAPTLVIRESCGAANR